MEQEALQFLNKGNYDGAIRAYLGILRLDPKDRRIRQRVGELSIKIGKVEDAQRHLREVADGLVKENNHRAAVALFKMLVQLRPDDPPLQVELGDCYLAAGYPNDARAHFDTAVRGFIGTSKYLQAAGAQRRIADLSPAEPALKLKVAELLESGSDPVGAAKVYDEVIEEYRRRGRPDEVGRVAEMALKVRPDDLGLLLDAAGARIEAQDFKRGLAHLQLAFNAAPKEPRTLDLLGRAFEGTGQPEKALKVIAELARVCADRNDPQGEVDALRRAARLSPDDLDIKQRLVEAEKRVSRLERRLTALVLAQPANEDELRAVVRAEVLARYGFTDRAEETLRAALDARRDALSLRAALAELLVSVKRVDEALILMQALLPLAGGEGELVLDRMAVLGARPPAKAAAVVEAPVTEAAPVVDEGEAAELRGDRLAASGNLVGAMMAYREALQEDPLNDEVLGKIAALRNASRGVPVAKVPEPEPEIEPEPLDEGTFAEVSPDALDELGDDDPISEARGLVGLSYYDEALALVRRATGLMARVVEAQAVRGKGDVQAAVDILQRATNDAAETDEGYVDALFELSGLYASTGKQRAAVRLLEEVKDLDPAFRQSEVDARIRGLSRALK